MCSDMLRATSAIETFNRMNLVSAEKLAGMENAGKLAVTPEQFAVLASADAKIHKPGSSELYSNMTHTSAMSPDKEHRKEKKKKNGHKRIESFDDDDDDDNDNDNDG